MPKGAITEQQFASANAKVQSLQAKEKAGELSEIESAELDLAQAQISNYQLQQSANPADAKTKNATIERGETMSGQNNVRVLPASAEKQDYLLGVALQSIIGGQVFHQNPIEFARDQLGNDDVAAALTAYQSANNFSAGGSWIAGDFSDRFIALLGPESVVRRAGAVMVPLEDGTLTTPKVTEASSGSYLGENEPASVGSIGTGQVKLIAKELVSMVVASEKLLRSRSANAAERIRQIVLQTAGETEDLYFLRGTPSGAGPTGLRHLCDAANVIAANATVNLQNITSDLGKLDYALMGANVKMRRPAYFMNPRTLIYLMDLRDGNGNLAFPSLQSEMPRLRNKPVYATTQIPANLSSGGSANESEIILADMNHILIGQAPQISFQSSNVAAYRDNAGGVHAAFSERRVVSRLVMENDLQTEHPQAIAVLTEVDWGA